MSSVGRTFSGDDRVARMRRLPSVVASLVERALPVLEAGRFQVVLPNGAKILRNGAKSGPEATMIVHRWRALWRMLLGGDHGFADGYLDGDWSTSELDLLLELFMRNESVLTPQADDSWLGLARHRLAHWWRANSRRGSRRNIAAHYDLGNDFFLPWLDHGMSYSSALYAGGDTLEAAQDRKLDRAASLLDLRGGERVLEIGCGWGALAERLIRRHGATVTGLTLSTEQLAYTQARLAGGIERGRADIRLQDYRDVEGCYDRIASIEMIEAVGERYWPIYFAKLRASLRPGGTALLQAITIEESRFAGYRHRADYIQRHIFPGGLLPTASIIEREADRAGLKLVHRESFGDSYAKTLREWRSRFLQAWPAIEPLGFNERFRRMWEYYLVYCEIGFRFGVIDVGFFKLAG
jgi:cyclopropane-fatty-acyl-phospholipid synthase